MATPDDTFPAEKRPAIGLDELEGRDRTRDAIERCVRYESFVGITTYHQCPCGRYPCRRGQCAECWREVLAQLEAAEQSTG